jgi:hypothetical protein
MQQFEKQFENLDLQTQVVEGVMSEQVRRAALCLARPCVAACSVPGAQWCKNPPAVPPPLAAPDLPSHSRPAACTHDMRTRHAHTTRARARTPGGHVHAR